MLLLLLLEGITQPSCLVRLCVVVKTCLLSKTLVAARDSAGIRSQLGVSAHMLVNNCLLSEPFTTDTTLKWFLPSVLPHVNFQMRCLFEGFSTVFAVEWPDCIVLSHVLH